MRPVAPSTTPPSVHAAPPSANIPMIKGTMGREKHLRKVTLTAVAAASTIVLLATGPAPPPAAPPTITPLGLSTTAVGVSRKRLQRGRDEM